MRHGFLLIDKPVGITSHDAVSIVRKKLGERSIGHLGTLDPAASGLLVLAIGRKALRVVELFNTATKAYEAGVKFGEVSTTYDREGVIEKTPDIPGFVPPDESRLQNAIADRFIGKIKQKPPAYSAIKIDGQRAYDKARSGQEVEMPEREVQITRCDIVKYKYPELKLLVECGSGTYIRSLAHDLGQLFFCGAYLTDLRRTKILEWNVVDAVKPDDVVWGNVIPLKDILKDFPRRDLTDDEWEDVSHGRQIEATIEEPFTIGWHNELPVTVLIQTGEGVAKGRKVFG